MFNKVVKEIWKEMTKLQKFVFFTILGAIIIGFFSLVSCAKFREYVPPEGAIEEISEAIIEKTLDLPSGTVDLSPSSPEA